MTGATVGDAPPNYEYVLKAKGITMDFDACKALSYEEMRNRVVNYDNAEILPLRLKYNMLRPNIRGFVHTVHTQKKYKTLITKGVIRNNLQVVPFGYFDPRINSHFIAQQQYDTQIHIQ